MKQYIGISRDHSLSMTNLGRAAMKDYNQTIDAIKNAANGSQIDTIVSVVECGRPQSYENYIKNQRGGFDPFRVEGPGIVRRDIVNSNVNQLQEMITYPTDGRSTPLLDSVGELIDIFESVPDYHNKDVSFLVMAITDGEENSSQRWDRRKLALKIQQLDLTGRWTFAFRCPRGYSENLVRLGIPRGNILEWDQTERGVETATTITTSAFDSYYTIRSAGVTNTNKFFVDIGTVPVAKVKSELIDISSKVDTRYVANGHAGMLIRDFYEMFFGKDSYVAGTVYYELTKTEKVQPSKKLIVLDTKTEAMYTGKNVRDLLGLPDHAQINLTPNQLGQYKVFVQSTSFTRKLAKGTRVLIYKA